MEQFYELRGAQLLSPVAPAALRPRDDAWLRTLVQQAELDAGPGGTAALKLAVQGLSCVGCVWLVEKVFRGLPGAVHLDVHVARGEMYLHWQPGIFDVPGFAARIQQFGYLAGPAGASSGSESVQSASFGRRVGLCGAFAMNAMAFSLPAYLGMGADFLFASWFDIIAACSATLALLVGGSYFMERSWQSLRHGVLHMDTPVALGIGFAWTGSMTGWLAGEPGLKYFDFVAIFVFLMLAGRWLQQGALDRNRRRLLECSNIPQSILRRAPGSGEMLDAPLAEVVPGDRVQVAAGGICPVAGVLESAAASLSLEWINGESAASIRTQGQRIPSGSVNIGSVPLELLITEKWEDSLLCRLGASGLRGDTAAVSSRLLRGYLCVVLFLGVAGALAWAWAGHGWAAALQVMISVFVVSCPCALGVSAPFADDLAATWMERLGVFVRAGGLWARLMQVRQIVFDKTGTLTLENPLLIDPGVVAALDPEARTVLRELVGSNLHPVSRSLFDALGPLRSGGAGLLEAPLVVEEVVGQGTRLTDKLGRRWSLGRPGWRGGAEGPGANSAPAWTGDAELACDGQVVAGFSFSDALRPATVDACNQLRKRGYELYLFSGDRKAKVRDVAGQLQLPSTHWEAEMTPEGKAARVRQMDQGDTLYIGDGANDCLALEEALCGGSPVTGRNFLEHRADFYFLGNSLRFVPALLEMAALRTRAVRRVFAFALTYNAAAVGVSLAGWMSPLLAAIIMPLSSILTLALVRWTFQSGGRAKFPVTSGFGRT
jgi:Cu2+-exporting ATPase